MRRPAGDGRRAEPRLPPQAPGCERSRAITTLPDPGVEAPAIPAGLRDRHLFAPGPKRILSLSGGGVRGALTIAFLEGIEAALSRREGRAVLLGDWFDLIAGTSTGAIIATALALGYRAADLRTLYERLGPRIFRPHRFRIFGLQPKFDSAILAAELKTVIGERTLASEDLRTGLCIVLKRIDTGSTWLLANNPRSAFWDTPDGNGFIGNRHLRLASVVRASTAAPHLFDPELITLVQGMPPGLFLDGGLTPHNNPALAALLMATLPAYGLGWPLGADRLTIVSVGTGSFRHVLTRGQARRLGAIGLAVRALAAQIADAELLTLTLMTWLGETPTRWPMNAEIGDLAGAGPGFGPLFRFLRYDARLEAPWLEAELGLRLSAREAAGLQRMDEPANIPAIYDIGRKAAARQVKDEDLVPSG